MGKKNKLASSEAAFSEVASTGDATLDVALGLFAEGKDRHEVAKMMGYANYKSVDMYFRRRNYRWDAELKTYTLNKAHQNAEERSKDIATSQVRRIIALMSAGNKDPREAAAQIGFSDIQEMADYMMEWGYVWDCESENYVKKSKAKAGGQYDNKETPGSIAKESEKVSTESEGNTPENLTQYFNLLSFLQKHEDRLWDILSIRSDLAVPRYAIADMCITKSFHIPIVLNETIKDFAQERNISQKDIITVALIEFLSKYGFSAEIERMLNNGKL